MLEKLCEKLGVPLYFIWLLASEPRQDDGYEISDLLGRLQEAVKKRIKYGPEDTGYGAHG